MAASTTTASAASSSINYTCQLTNKGLERKFSDPWTVAMTAEVPASVAPGAKIPAPKITAAVTTGKDAADQLRSLKVKTVEGSAKASYSFGTSGRSVDLTIPKVSVPSNGGIVTKASGTGGAETAPSAPGTVDVKAGSFTSDQTTDTGFVLNISCAPAAGAKTTIATIKVGSTAPSTSKSPTTSTSPTTPKSPTTSTSPTTPKSPTTSTSPTASKSPTTSASPTTSTGPTTSQSPTTSSSPATSPTATPTSGETSSTAAPAPTSSGQGPKVETDHESQGSMNLAGVALAAAGVMAIGGAAFAGRREH